MIRRRVAAVGLDPALFAGHSLRSGYISTVAEAGADLNKMASHAGPIILRGPVFRAEARMPWRGSQHRSRSHPFDAML